MSMLPDLYAPAGQGPCRVIILDSPEAVREYLAAGGRFPEDGQLFGRYWVQPATDGPIAPSPGSLISAGQFAGQYRKVATPAVMSAT